MSGSILDLAQRLNQSKGVQITQGVVTAVDEPTVTVTIAGSDVEVDEVQHLDSCAPKVGDVVWIATDGSDLWILGTHGEKPPVAPSDLPSPQAWFAAVDPAGPPAAPQGVKAETTLSGIVLSFTLPPEALFRTWEIFEGATAGFTPTTPIATIDTTVYTIPHDPGSGPWYLKIRAKNTRGEYSDFVSIGPLTLDTVPEHIDASGITGTMISDGAIQSPKIAAAAISADKIAANAITSEKIAANAITAGKIAAGAITAESGVIASIDAGKITTGYMTATRIQGGTLTSITITGCLIRGGSFETYNASGTNIIIETSDYAPGPIYGKNANIKLRTEHDASLQNTDSSMIYVMSRTNYAGNVEREFRILGPRYIDPNMPGGGLGYGPRLYMTNTMTPAGSYVSSYTSIDSTNIDLIGNVLLSNGRLLAGNYASLASTTDGGIWIQDSYTTAQKWKLVFNSNTKKLVVGNGTTSYSVTLT